MEELKNHGKKWFYWVSIGIAIIVVYKVLDQLTNITEAVGNFFNAISPVLAGVFVAYLLYLPCRKVENFYKKSKVKIIKKKSRGLSILTIYIIAIIIIAIILTSILPILIESAKELITNSEEYIKTAIQKYQELPNDSFLKGEAISQAINKISAIDLSQYINVNNISEYAKGAIGVVTGIFNVFVTIIVSVYVLAERDRICNFAKKAGKAFLSSPAYRSIQKYFHSANEIFSGFIVSQVIDGIVVSILSMIVLSIMGIKYAPLLGFIIGLFNLIPYVGAIIGVGIALVITLITCGVSDAIWMLIVITILQQIDANVINPKIVGNSLKISPLLVIIAVMIGGTYWGMLGMFIAVPICALIKILAEDYIDYKTKMKSKEAQKRKQLEENII